MREYQLFASPQATFSNPSNGVKGPVMVTTPANTPKSAQTHTHNPFLLYLGLQPCISYALLAPHTHCTRKQKSILSTSQCHHNYSFETAIDNKLHLHCVFIRLLWVSNAQRPGLPCLCQPTDPSPQVCCLQSVANDGSGALCVNLNCHITEIMNAKRRDVILKNFLETIF